jgi:hypothetical protein
VRGAGDAERRRGAGRRRHRRRAIDGRGTRQAISQSRLKHDRRLRPFLEINTYFTISYSSIRCGKTPEFTVDARKRSRQRGKELWREDAGAPRIVDHRHCIGPRYCYVALTTPLAKGRKTGQKICTRPCEVATSASAGSRGCRTATRRWTAPTS